MKTAENSRASVTVKAVIGAVVVAFTGVVAWQSLLHVQLDRFRQITPAMTMDLVESRIGKPDRRGGSGFIFYYYRLANGSEVEVAGNTQEVFSVTHAGRELMDSEAVASRDAMRRFREEQHARATRTSATHPASIAVPDPALHAEHLRRSKAAIPLTVAPPR